MKTAEEVALKPCPFCHDGMQDQDLIDRPKKSYGQGAYWIRCECGARGPVADDSNEAAEFWNRRIP